MEKCCFYTAKECGATVYATCPEHCVFRKTKKEFEAGIAYAKQILEKKGLKPDIKSVGGESIMTVTEVNADI